MEHGLCLMKAAVLVRMGVGRGRALAKGRRRGGSRVKLVVLGEVGAAGGAAYGKL